MGNMENAIVKPATTAAEPFNPQERIMGGYQKGLIYRADFQLALFANI
jgi:hypothetical protein